MWTFDPTGAYVLLGFLLGFTWIFTGLRFFVRSSVIKSVFWDDWLILLSSVAYTAFSVFAVGILKNGLGTDVDDDEASIDLWSLGAFYFLFSELAFVISSTLLRVACAVMLLRVVLKKDKTIRLIIWITATTMVVYSVFFFFITLFQCRPVSFFWNYMYPGAVGSCLGNGILTSPDGGYMVMTIFFTVHSVVSVLCDWILGALPFFMLKSLQMGWRRKALIIVLLSLSALIGVAALVRIPLIIRANQIEFWDEAAPVAITTALEPALGTIALCCATLLPLFRKAKLTKLDSQDRGVVSGASQDPASGRKAPNHRAIVVETSWIVDDDPSEDSRGHNIAMRAV